MNKQQTVILGFYALILILAIAIFGLAAKIGKTQNYPAQPLGTRVFEQQ